MSEAPPKKGCLRQLILILLFALLIVGSLLLGGGWLALARLPGIIKWSAERAVPGITLELTSARLVDWNTLEAEGLVIRERESGDILGSSHVGRILLTPKGILRRELEEVILENPVIYLSPLVFKVLGREPTTPGDESAPEPWVIRRLRCDFGELYLRGFTDEELAVSLRFAFDFTDFGLGPETHDLSHQFEIWALSASVREDYQEPFAWLNLVTLGFRPGPLLQERQLDSVQVRGGRLTIGEALRRYFPDRSDRPADEPSASAPAPPWRVGELDISGLETTVADPRPEVADLVFQINTTFENIPLSALPEDLGNERQSIELANIEILSPRDPMVRVISLRSVFIVFTLADLLRQRILEMKILSPTIYVSEDLFLYMEKMKAAYGPADESAESDGPGWSLDRLEIQFGRLVIGGERRGQLGLPLDFQTEVNDVQLDDLASLRMKTSLKIAPSDREFPALKLSLTRLRGELFFSFPPETSPNNLVNTLYLEGLKWRQYEASDLWMSATLNREVISARFGGSAYGGYVNAGVDFFFGGDSRWVGWVTGSRISLKELTDVMAPGNVRMTGPADFLIQVDAASSRIERLTGNMKALRPGQLVIKKIDDLLEALPAEWTSIKRSSAVIALETIRDFDYEKAGADFWFVDGQGRLNLNLSGPTGTRNFDVYLHADESNGSLWNQGVTP